MYYTIVFELFALCTAKTIQIIPLNICTAVQVNRIITATAIAIQIDRYEYETQKLESQQGGFTCVSATRIQNSIPHKWIL